MLTTPSLRLLLVAQRAPVVGQVRTFVTLKDISNRLKSVASIQKITKSMKMVSAAKFAKAERELRGARPYGQGAVAFLDALELDTPAEDKPQSHLFVAVTSDKGLCGACHSSISKTIRSKLDQIGPNVDAKVVAIGDKSRGILQATHQKHILFHCADIGRKAPSFQDASVVAEHILSCGFEFDLGTMYYNVFKSAVQYQTTPQKLVSLDAIKKSEKLAVYDSIDDDVLTSYNEFSLTSLIYFGMKEGAASEQSSRMTAMENASKNAGEMIDKLALQYNRTRQAVITTELIEIISGAAALE